ncbi:unnamed protein product [Arabidopsis thaliana]|uniref:(thale cress) hypothetical protein n=1 Tax=Arabidopsis thaliana TaxID=3702 RepID=A0A7G2E0P7_ARATH|nr:unnamed protein product [Arabidopsis thaliana]
MLRRCLWGCGRERMELGLRGFRQKSNCIFDESVNPLIVIKEPKWVRD